MEKKYLVYLSITHSLVGSMKKLLCHGKILNMRFCQKILLLRSHFDLFIKIRKFYHP